MVSYYDESCMYVITVILPIPLSGIIMERMKHSWFKIISLLFIILLVSLYCQLNRYLLDCLIINSSYIFGIFTLPSSQWIIQIDYRRKPSMLSSLYNNYDPLLKSNINNVIFFNDFISLGIFSNTETIFLTCLFESSKRAVTFKSCLSFLLLSSHWGTL